MATRGYCGYLISLVNYGEAKAIVNFGNRWSLFSEYDIRRYIETCLDSTVETDSYLQWYNYDLTYEEN